MGFPRHLQPNLRLGADVCGLEEALAAAPWTLAGWSSSGRGISLRGGSFVTPQFQEEKPGEARGSLLICIPQAVPSGVKKNKPQDLILIIHADVGLTGWMENGQPLTAEV